MINLQNMMKYNIMDEVIIPKRGLIQGLPLSCLFFNLYIDKNISEMATQGLEREKKFLAQLFADDILIQSKNKEEIIEAIKILSIKLDNLEMEINWDKSHLVSNDETTINIELDNGNEINLTSTKSTSYLGHMINGSGFSAMNINNQIFGKLLGLFNKYTHKISRNSRIRIFKTYLQTKANHLIVHIVLSGEANKLWTVIRNVIFRSILNFDTTPREASNRLGLGFYDLIIKPVIKAIKSEYFDDKLDIRNWIIEKTKYMYKEWLIAENNLSENTKNYIANEFLSKNNSIPNLEEWKKIMINEGIERLSRGSGVSITNKNLKHPGILYYTSNAACHKIESMLYNACTVENNDDNDQITTDEIDSANDVITLLITMREYLNHCIEKKLIAASEPNYDWENIISEDLIRKNNILKRIKDIENEITKTADEILNKVIDEIYEFIADTDNRQKLNLNFINSNNNENNRLISKALGNLLNGLRQRINNCENKLMLWDLEMICDENFILKKNHKEKPRNILYKKNNNKKTKNNNKVDINNNNKKITDYVN